MSNGTVGMIGMVALVVVIVGALNWGLVGGFHFNLVEHLLGVGMATRVVYMVVGVAAVVVTYLKFIAKK
jgi:uncharacterized membrane protein YuzA (DUF378 family)